MQRLAGPDREPDSDQVDGAQRDGDRKPNRRFEGHGVILSTIWNARHTPRGPRVRCFSRARGPEPGHRTHICGDAFHQTGSMNERDLTRRGFVTQVAASALPLVSAPAEPEATRLTVVCVGAHPDDPESGCGGAPAPVWGAGPAGAVINLT